LSHPSKIIATFYGGSGGADFGQAGVQAGTAIPAWATTQTSIAALGGSF